MKKSEKNTKCSILTLFVMALGPLSASASPLGVVNQAQGNAFVIESGKTRPLSVGTNIEDDSEIITEVGGQVSFSDYHDHKFHLAGSGHVKFSLNKMELKQGVLWVQSFIETNNKKEQFNIQTANAAGATGTRGEAIISYDAMSGKTQLLVLKGQYQFSNANSPELAVLLGDGEFSFIPKDGEENQEPGAGAPREATPIGMKSYKGLLALFKGIGPMTADGGLFPENPAPKAEAVQMASATENGPAITYLISSKNKKVRAPASMRISTAKNESTAFNKEAFLKSKLSAVQNKKEKKKGHSPASVTKKSSTKTTSLKKSYVEVKIHGLGSAPVESSESTGPMIQSEEKEEVKKEAVPAKTEESAQTKSVVPKRNTASTKDEEEFEKSFKTETKKQMRHKDEVNELINELKNYRDEYQKDH